ncbi:MAG: quinone-dependent dihydroorotate dehydrogenase [Flavobacteriaceae bacterium]
MYKSLIRPLLFLFDAERIHHWSFKIIKIAGNLGLSPIIKKIYTVEDKRLEREICGLRFQNPVGLGAGFDKDAKLYNELSNFGFGFIEIGTLTPKAQAGNPKKRLFRLKTDRAIINRMGFNNGGVFEAVDRLKKNKNVLVGGNIGKNKDTPNKLAAKDYLICFDVLFEYVDYYVVNVSSPNTPGLRELQEKEPLTQLLRELNRENTRLAVEHGKKEKPIFLKIAPDLNEDQLLDIIEIVEHTGLDGIIATNTTISRTGLKSDLIFVEEKGGLSGKPLRERSTEVIRYIVENRKKKFAIIGVGGIHSAADAIEKFEAGADLIQLWTGFVYEGPALVKEINSALLRKI